MESTVLVFAHQNFLRNSGVIRKMRDFDQFLVDNALIIGSRAWYIVPCYFIDLNWLLNVIISSILSLKQPVYPRWLRNDMRPVGGYCSRPFWWLDDAEDHGKMIGRPNRQPMTFYSRLVDNGVAVVEQMEKLLHPNCKGPLPYFVQMLWYFGWVTDRVMAICFANSCVYQPQTYRDHYFGFNTVLPSGIILWLKLCHALLMTKSSAFGALHSRFSFAPELDYGSFVLRPLKFCSPLLIVITALIWLGCRVRFLASKTF